MRNRKCRQMIGVLLAGVLLLNTVYTDVRAQDLSSGDQTVVYADENDREILSGQDATTDCGDVLSDTNRELFAGLGEQYVFSAGELAEKEKLSDSLQGIMACEEGVNYVPGEVLYVAEDEAEAERIARAFNGSLESYGQNLAVIALPEQATVSDAVVQAADSETRLPAVWPNFYREVLEEEADQEDLYDVTALLNAYSDPYLSETSSRYQWHHAYVGSPIAWENGYTGSGIKIAVIDTGMLESHEDLTDNALPGKNYAKGENGSAEGTGGVDGNGHGTHVAGIIAAKGNNAKGGCGIAPDATITSYRVFSGDSGNAQDKDILRALGAAVEDGNDLVNMSIGSPYYNGEYEYYIDRAVKAGCAIFAAAGNNGSTALSYPAAFDGVYSVAALYPSGGKTYFSNYGPTVDFAFPGWDMHSTYNGGKFSYAAINGTSQACPVAVGTAAVILSAQDEIPALKGKKGKDRVEALGLLMKKSSRKAKGSGLGAGSTYLPKALSLTDVSQTPKAPVFSQKAGTYYEEKLIIRISAQQGLRVVYSLDGKAPTYKNGYYTGIASDTSSVTVTLNQKNVGKNGTATLKAIAFNKSGMVSSVTTAKYVLRPNATKLSITSPVKQVPVGKSIVLSASVYPEYAYSTKVKWKVKDEGQGVTIGSDGRLSVAKDATAGVYTVTATGIKRDEKGKKAEGLTAEIDVTVLPSCAISEVAFAEKKIECSAVRGTEISTAGYLRVRLADGSAGDIAHVYFTSNKPEIASVNAESGVVTLQGKGTATIIATAMDGSGKKASVKIVSKILANKVVITGGSEKLAAGCSIQFGAYAVPSDMASQKVRWSVEPAGQGVSISRDGVLRAASNAKAGQYYVTASAKDGSGVADTKSVTLCPCKIRSIKLSDKAVTIFTTRGNSSSPNTKQLTAEIRGTDDGYDYSANVTWSSKNYGIASVSPSGIVTAVKPGTTVITCAANDGSGKKATCKVTVAIPMSKLTISPLNGMYATSKEQKTGYISKGGTVAYKASYGMEYGMPTDTSVVWSIANTSVATVDRKGRVTAREKGSTTLTARAADGSGVYATYNIEVTEKATGVVIEKVWVTGNTVDFIIRSDADPVFMNAHALDVTVPDGMGVVYSTDSGRLMLKVYLNGRRKAGRITVKLLDGSGISASAAL